MTTAQARSIIGNQPTWAIKNMIKALQMFTMLNTAEDWQRLEAAKIILRERNREHRIHRSAKA